MKNDEKTHVMKVIIWTGRCKKGDNITTLGWMQINDK